MGITQVDAQDRDEYGTQGRHTTSAYFLVVEMIEPTRRRQSYVARLLLHPTGMINLESRDQYSLQACIDASIQSTSDPTVAVATNGTATNGLTLVLSQTGGC